MITSEDLALHIERNYDASAERLFSAWTDPDKLRQWFAPSEELTVEADVDLRVGGRYRVAMGPYIVEGIYKEITPSKRLVFTWQWQGESPSNEMLVAIDFIEEATGTKVKLTHTRLADQQAREQHNTGWQALTDRLEQFLETE